VQELEALKVVAVQRLIGGQEEFDLGLGAVAAAGPLPITSTRMSHPWDALCRAYERLGFDTATDTDVVFRDLSLVWMSSPVTPSIAAATTDRACTSSPTLVRSGNTGPPTNVGWVERAATARSPTNVVSEAPARGPVSPTGSRHTV
jgi:hypothetical protein